MEATRKKNIVARFFAGEFKFSAPVAPPPTKAVSQSSGEYREFYTHSFNGEKNQGELGPIKNYDLDYKNLRIRSWQAYLESEIAQTIIRRYDTWIIGQGLKLQSEPEKTVLRMEGIELDKEPFSKNVEARFNLFKTNRRSDHKNMTSIDEIASQAHINAINGGDVLVILRITDTYDITVQLVDGAHVCSPGFVSEFAPQTLENGNIIRNGIEFNGNGEHVAYWVKKGFLGIPERVAARGEKTGLLMAFMVYGLKYRLDNMRGIPLLAVVQETLAKMERYKEATIGSAEEQAKVALQVVHNVAGSGDNPMKSTIMKAHDADAKELPRDSEGKEVANTISVSTKKQAFNLPPGAEVKSLNPSKGQNIFPEFYGANIDVVCATIEIPPNVAMQKYDTSFSSARAALKDWENTVIIKRVKFSNQFYSPIYELWLYVQILRNKISAPGYLQARLKKNQDVVDAYHKARFTGPGVPHIDPYKEVKAVREKLGTAGAHLPLITLERATEELGGGESESNLTQFSTELEEAESLDIPILQSGADGTDPLLEDAPAKEEDKKKKKD